MAVPNRTALYRTSSLIFSVEDWANTLLQIEVHSLASGSNGNAVLIKAGGEGLLIDAGLSGRTLGAALQRRGITSGHLAGILITHEHDDHVRGAPALSSRFAAPVIANRPTLTAANLRGELPRTVEIATGGEICLGQFLVRSFGVSHDAAEPVGYVIQAGGVKVFYATDLGCPSEAVYQAMRGAALCVLESNHDVEWLRRGPYPSFMKARVASDRGHLSNADATTLITRRLEDDGPTTVWLAHLSAVNNSPAFARRYVAEGLRAGTSTVHQLDVALRGRPSAMWRVGSIAVQKTLF